jgi:sugar/nucleoside kinase (ribokinase family)
MREPHLILGIGELLWDVLPDGMRLGGAPANFAVLAGRLGDRAAILSRIGGDDLGRRAVERLDPMPVETSFLEVDRVHETGRVTVSFTNGEPHYTIHEPAAWDFLERRMSGSNSSRGQTRSASVRWRNAISRQDAPSKHWLPKAPPPAYASLT